MLRTKAKLLKYSKDNKSDQNQKGNQPQEEEVVEEEEE